MFFKLKPIKIPFLFKKYVMRAGPQLRGAKAARAPPGTLPILGRLFILTTTISNHLITQKSRIIPKKKCFVINAKKGPSRVNSKALGYWIKKF